jgi:hypothetical protein
MQEERGGAVGRSGRLDMSGLTRAELYDEVDDDAAGLGEMRDACDWCGQPRGSGYVVAAPDRCDALCPICWGRSPAYLEWRGEGLTHDAALNRLRALPG